MNDQKLENLLNLALDATDAEREKSLNMNFGYDRQNRIWELIVRYHGDLSGVGERTKEIILLSGGYAIITAEESEIDWISSQPEVEYIEKPKRLFFSAAQGRSVILRSWCFVYTIHPDRYPDLPAIQQYIHLFLPF